MEQICNNRYTSRGTDGQTSYPNTGLIAFGRVSCSIRGPYLKEPQWQLNIFSRDDRREIVFFVRKNSIRKLRFPFNKCFDATRSIVGGKTSEKEEEKERGKKRKKEIIPIVRHI